MSRPTARVPFLVMLTAAVSAAVVVSESGASPDAPASTRRAPSPVSALMPLAPTAVASASTHYCAAGTGDPGGMADHTVVVVNIGDVPVAARVTPYGGDVVGRQDGGAAETTPDPTLSTEGPAPQRNVSVPPAGRVAVRLGDLLEAPFVAAVVEIDGGPAVVEHEVTGPQGRDTGPCATRAGTDWHVAWGATTRDAREVLVVFNPFPSPASIDAVFRVDGGGREPERFQGVPVPAGRVVALDVGAEVRREHEAAATIRTRRGHVIVERLQSFDGSDGPAGLSVALASSEPATGWAFAAGEVSDAGAPIVAVYNPSEERAEVDVAVLPDAPADGGAEADGEDAATGDEAAVSAATVPQPFGLSIGPGDYRVVHLGDEERVPAGVDLAIVVSSRNGVPVVAERVIRTAAVADGRADEDRSGAADDGGPGGDTDATDGEGTDEEARGAADPAGEADAGDGDGAGGGGAETDREVAGTESPADDDASVPAGGLAVGPGAPVASRTWWFGGLVVSGAPAPTVAVLNLESRPARVSLRAVTSGAVVGSTVVSVAPGKRRTIDLGAGPLVGDSALVLASDVPVVAERLVAGGGTIQAMGPGVAAVDGAVPVTLPSG